MYEEDDSEKVFVQEWLEYFHYIGWEAARQKFPEQYTALLPYSRGQKQRPPMQPVVPEAAKETAKMFLASDSDEDERHKDKCPPPLPQRCSQ